MVGLLALAVVCTLAGFVQIGVGLLGKRRSAEPRCARCGYDLRGHSSTQDGRSFVDGRCSECGSDLWRVGAITRATRQRSPRRALLGLAFILFPWLIGSLVRVVKFIGPHGEGLRSNQSIMNALDADPQPSWEWETLADRSDAGKLSRAEASGVVDRWIARCEPGSQRDEVGDFFSKAHVSTAQYTSLARDFWGQSNVELKVREVTSDHINFDVKMTTHGKPVYTWRFEHAVGLAGVTLVRDGNHATTQTAGRWDGIDPNTSTFEPLLRRYMGRLSVKAPAVKYNATFTFNVGIAAFFGTNTLLDSFGSQPTPPPGCIAITVAVPIEIPHPLPAAINE